MEEGSLRCDANVSIRLKGETSLGTKVEVKNLNSIRNVKKAIEFEIERMIKMAENGETITQQTRSFNADNDTTFSIRDKEEANDYRYFAEPDLTPFQLTESYIDSIRKALPSLPEELNQKFQSEFSLSEYDAAQLSDDKGTADYFLAVTGFTQNYKAVSNWLTGPIRQYLNEHQSEINEFALTPASLAELIKLIDNGKVNFSIASSKIFPALMNDTGKSPLQIATELNLLQVSDSSEIDNWVNDVIAKMPEKVTEYRKGKKGLIGLFVGEVKKLSKGKADPKVVTKLLEEKLQS
jgi:aspartyl-tRNA(Asn)/glutamyl-tRNA(Gln) amidotransferase subunit B